MYQLLLRLEVERDCAWERRYHRKIRGRFDQALQGSNYDGLHDTDRAAFTWSDPMPYSSELEAGDELHLLVSAPDRGILAAIASDLEDEPRITAGAFVFDVRAAIPIEADVGTPGSEGTIRTSSGVLLTVEPDYEGETSTPTYWTEREHTVDVFRENLQQSTNRLLEHETELDQLEIDPFDDYHHRKTYAVDVEVVPGQDVTVIASKWGLGYEVRDEHHRDVLNTLLGTGIGAKRAYGFGMLQTSHDTDVRTGTREAVATDGGAR